MVVIINLLIKKLETIRDIECIRNKYNDLDHPWIINFPETMFEETYIINRLIFLIIRMAFDAMQYYDIKY